MKRALWMLVALFLLWPLGVRAQAVAGQNASLREAAQVYKQAAQGDSYGELEAGTEVEVLALRDEWAKIRYMFREGYVYRRVLEATIEQAEPEVSTTLLGRTVYVYQQVRLQSYVNKNLTTLYPGDEVLLLGVSGDQAQVLLVSRSGTVPLSYLAVDKELHYVLGMPGDSNRDIEARLEQLGYFDGIPDDLFDLETAEAVIRLRVQAGLSDEFLIDEALMSVLEDQDAPYSPICIASLKVGDSGTLVKRLQTRLVNKGYLEDTPLGYFDSLTSQAVMLYQQMEGFEQSGQADAQTLSRLFSGEARKMPRNLMPASRETSIYLPGGVVNIDWWTGGIQDIYAKGTIAEITDIETGITWHEMRRGGSSHADVQPVTAQDTEAFKAAAGGAWSWQRRAIWVSIDGVRYAASMNCMPHGDGAIQDNNFPGHHCIHFLNSRTHGGDNLDEEHQACVAIAAQTDYVTTDNVNWASLYSGESGPQDTKE